MRNYSNTAVLTQLVGAITDAADTLDVADASGYPDAPFTIQVESEIILVGAKSGVTFSSLTRGYDGTTAASHGNGAIVKHTVVALDHARLGGANVADEVLIAWVAGEAFQQTTNAAYSAEGLVESCNVEWPDGSTGTFSTTAWDDDGNRLAYQITHTASGKKVVQAEITFDADGNAETVPALTVTTI